MAMVRWLRQLVGSYTEPLLGWPGFLCWGGHSPGLSPNPPKEGVGSVF